MDTPQSSILTGSGRAGTLEDHKHLTSPRFIQECAKSWFVWHRKSFLIWGNRKPYVCLRTVWVALLGRFRRFDLLDALLKYKKYATHKHYGEVYQGISISGFGGNHIQIFVMYDLVDWHRLRSDNSMRFAQIYSSTWLGRPGRCAEVKMPSIPDKLSGGKHH
jgi:hypothetical protein